MRHRFPFIRQIDSKGCASACIRMICKWHKRKSNPKEVSELLHSTVAGTSIKAIEEALTNVGFESESFLSTTDALGEIYLPAILHWNQNHFVILYGISQNNERYDIADPGKGLLSYTRKDFENHWISSKLDNAGAGVVTQIIPSSNISDGNEANKGKESKKTLRTLMKYFRQHRSSFLKVVFCLLLGCMFQLVMPFLTQATVDWGIRNKDIGLVWLVLAGELMIVVGRTAAEFIKKRILLNVSMKINISLISDFFIKLLKLPMSFFDKKLMGDLLQRISDHARVQNFITGNILILVFTLLSFVVLGIALLVYNSIAFGIFVTGSLIYVFWIISFLKRRKTIDYELFECQSINQNKTFQFINSIQEIKLQACEKRRRLEWEDTQAKLFQVQMKSLKMQQKQEVGSVLINEIKNIVITVITATAVIDSRLTLGGMLAVQYIIGQLGSPIEQLMSFIYNLQDVKISLERINAIHEEKDEDTKEDQATGFYDNKDIVLRDVDFKYDRNQHPKTLDGISLDIPSGKVTAIVGASGSGKTTLIKLMLGYYPVISGEISIAGRNINEYNLKWWRRRCGVVMQDGVIFSESIARNIAIDDEAIDEERLEKSAKIANIHDYVMGLPLKYNTIIGQDGLKPSKGQRQRILIARAAYKDPDFIFLDEATNSLDAINERAIVENLNVFYKGRTVIVVAHRLSTVKTADQIIVIDGGRVVEKGTHSDLIKHKGTYYALVKNQLDLTK